MATTLNSHEECSSPLRREVIARRSEADPPAEEELAGVMEVLAKAPVLLRADASAEQRQRDERRMIGRAKYDCERGFGVSHLVIRARSSGVERVRDRTFCTRNIG